MKVQWLGTAAAEGWPALFCRCESCRRAAELGGKNIRMRASALVDDELLIDAGPDLYAQKLRFNLDLALVRAILITHIHSDHFLPDTFELLDEVYVGGEKRAKTELYGPVDVIEKLGDYSHLLELHPVSAGDAFDTCTGHHVIVLPAVHSAENGVFYLVQKERKSMLYAHDTGVFSNDAKNILRAKVTRPIDIVSFDCCYGALPHDYGGHMGIEENALMKKFLENDLLADGHTYYACNHFSHNCRLTHDELLSEAGRFGMDVCFDGMQKEV